MCICRRAHWFECLANKYPYHLTPLTCHICSMLSMETLFALGCITNGADLNHLSLKFQCQWFYSWFALFSLIKINADKIITMMMETEIKKNIHLSIVYTQPRKFTSIINAKTHTHVRKIIKIHEKWQLIHRLETAYVFAIHPVDSITMYTQL